MTIEFPPNEPRRRRPSHRADAPVPSQRHATVLVVDDEAHIRKAIRIALSREGFTVIEAADGQAGWEILQSLRPDVILTDIAMPKMDGRELLRLVRAHAELASVPIIAVSALAGTEDQTWSLAMGADDVIVKPFSLAELAARVRARLPRIEESAPAEDAPLAEVVELHVVPDPEPEPEPEPVAEAIEVTEPDPEPEPVAEAIEVTEPDPEPEPVAEAIEVTEPDDELVAEVIEFVEPEPVEDEVEPEVLVEEAEPTTDEVEVVEPEPETEPEPDPEPAISGAITAAEIVAETEVLEATVEPELESESESGFVTVVELNRGPELPTPEPPAVATPGVVGKRVRLIGTIVAGVAATFLAATVAESVAGPLGVAAIVILAGVIAGGFLIDLFGGLVVGLAGAATMTLVYRLLPVEPEWVHPFLVHSAVLTTLFVAGPVAGTFGDQWRRKRRMDESRDAFSGGVVDSRSIGVLTAVAAAARLEEESARALFHNRPLAQASITVEPLDDSLTADDITRLERAVTRIIESDLHPTDSPYVHAHGIGVIMPEVNAEQAMEVLEPSVERANEATFAQRTAGGRTRVADVARIDVDVIDIDSPTSAAEAAARIIAESGDGTSEDDSRTSPARREA